MPRRQDAAHQMHVCLHAPPCSNDGIAAEESLVFLVPRYGIYVMKSGLGAHDLRR
jgi:hypothetical protein